MPKLNLFIFGNSRNLCLKGELVVDTGFGVDAVPLEVERGCFFFVLAVDVEEEEAAAAAAEVEVLGLFAGVAADLGVGVVDGAASDFDETGFGML